MVVETDLQKVAVGAEITANIILKGDLSNLNPAQKVAYYKAFCHRVGLDPVTKPFEILSLNGKQVLYCVRSGTQQLSNNRKVSHAITSRERADGLYVVTCRASQPDGRSTESLGAVVVEGLKGEPLANAMMKAETKAKRRATLDLVGLGLLDETEVDSIPGAQKIAVNLADDSSAEVLDGASGAVEVVDTRNWRLDFIARAKKCGWTTAAKQQDLVNNGMRERGLQEVRKASEVGPADWRALFAWLDARYDEDGKQRPKKEAASPPAARAPDAAGNGIVPDAASEIELPGLPDSEPDEAPEPPSREEFVGLVNEAAQVFTKAGHKRTFLVEHKPGSGRLFFMDSAILIEAGSTHNGAAKPVLVWASNDADAEGRNAQCSDAMVELLLKKLKEAQRAIGR